MSAREDERRRAAARELRQQQLMSTYNMPRPNIDYRKIASDVYDNMSPLDKAALFTAPVPVVGDVVGAVADGVGLFNDFSLTNLGLAVAGLLPFVPSGGLTRNLRQAIPQAPNYLPKFYAGGKPGQLYGMGAGAIRGGLDLAKARYSPTARGLFNETRLSVPDVRVAKEFMSEYKKGNPDIRTLAKKAMGQQRQSFMFDRQYGDPSSFRKTYEGYDEVAFADKFGAKEYYDAVKGATNLTRKDLNSVFREMSKKDIQNINPKKKYQMTVRRPVTQAAGNLSRIFNKPVFGGLTGGQMKKVFNGKKFKTDKEFLEALQANKVGVRNPEEVLKGQPAIVTGSFKSDAFELGGVNNMTAIKKEGTMTSFVNDEHDLTYMKAPGADRMISVSTPITFDLLMKGDGVKKVSKKVLDAEEARRISRTNKADDIVNNLSKLPGVDSSLPVPPGMSRPQFLLIQAAASAKPKSKDYSRILKDVGLFGPTRAARAVLRPEEEQ